MNPRGENLSLKMLMEGSAHYFPHFDSHLHIGENIDFLVLALKQTLRSLCVPNLLRFSSVELFSSGVILVEYAPTDEQCADMLTKAFGKTKFVKHRKALITYWREVFSL